MKALTYSLYLKEPLLATQPASGEPNSASSYDFVPGSLLRGALIAAFMRKHKGTIDDLARDERARKLFFDGNVRFLNAYPYSFEQSLNRMLPLPKSWHVEKGDSGNFAVPLVDFANAQARSLENPQRSEGSYCLIRGSSATVLIPAQQITVHNASEERGIKKGGNSQVFRYEALAAGQLLAAAIICADEDEALLANILQDLPDELYLGGSSNAAYGHVLVQDKKLVSDWQEYTPGAANGAAATITLLSDAIVRTSSGSYSAGISAALGANLQPKESYVRTRVVGGFNRKWGMPLPQALAIEQGSVFVYPAAEAARLGLEQLVQSGIGERTVEGFGRIALNWHTSAEYSRRKVQPQPSYESLALRSQDSKRVAQRILNRHLEDRLEDGLAAALDVNIIRFDRLPSKTQLSRARVAVQHALRETDLNLVNNHLNNLKGAKKFWEKAKLNDEPLLDWIDKQCGLSSSEVERKFLLAIVLQELAGLKAAVTDDMSLNIKARYVDGVLKLAIEEQKRLKGAATNG